MRDTTHDSVPDPQVHYQFTQEDIRAARDIGYRQGYEEGFSDGSACDFCPTAERDQVE
jgi:hypothetical protein